MEYLMKLFKKNRFEINYYWLVTGVVGSAFVDPTTSYASGDPSIVYFVGSSAFVHIFLFIYLSIKEKNIIQKIIKLSVYTFLTILLWNWAMHMRNPHFLIPDSILFCGPGILTFLLLRI